MTQLYPLRLEPICRPKPWGGWRLTDPEHEDFPPGVQIGESWEVSDYPGQETVVANGELAGTPLRHLVAERTAELVGSESILQAGRLPLLVKYLNAGETLSVQVHPDNAYAAEHENGFGKREAWYIMRADPGAKLIREVTPGTTRETFRQALDKRQLEPCLHVFEPKAGDVVMIDWGTVHAIGKGILLAEIQQTSDITYRVYDWNRVNEDGEPRKLHVKEALDVTVFDQHTPDTCERKLLSDRGDGWCEGARCDEFVIEIIELAGAVEDAPPPGRFLILNVVRGHAVLEDGEKPMTLRTGASVLIPACVSRYTLRSDDATVLRSYVP